MSEQTRNGNLLFSVAAGTIVLLGASACTSSQETSRAIIATGALAPTAMLETPTAPYDITQDTNPPITVPSTEATAPAPPTTSETPAVIVPEQVSAYQLLSEYTADPERNAILDAVVLQTAEKIVAVSESGELGRFEFYNFDTGDWGGEGWGALQHNSQYGGSESQIIAFVYRNNDGTYDLSKGVQEVSLDANATNKDTPNVSISIRPNGNIETSSYISSDLNTATGELDYGYSVGTQALASEDTLDITTIKSFDDQALADFQTVADDIFN